MSIAEKYRPYYTYDDYCQWEGNWELIEGMPFAMSPAPVPEHQSVNGNIYEALKISLRKACKKCKAYLPLDWKISEDTVMQPDVLVVCNRIDKKYLDFPPVLVLEVLSPSSAAKDRGLKFEVYQSQQVKYYLIADPQFKKLEVYQLLNNKYEPIAVNPQIYTFNLHEDCHAEVDLSNIWE